MKVRSVRSLVFVLPLFAVACASATDPSSPSEGTSTDEPTTAEATGAVDHDEALDREDLIPPSELSAYALEEIHPNVESEYDSVAPEVEFPEAADDISLFQDAPSPGLLDVHGGDFQAQGADVDLPDEVTTEALSRATRAINWYARHRGSSAWEGWCLRAAANSYGRAHAGFPTAYSLWVNRVKKGVAHRNRKAPKGALVFWKTSAAGHVGVADGKGGFWSSSVNRRIGHAKLPYFRNYLGWAPKPW